MDNASAEALSLWMDSAANKIMNAARLNAEIEAMKAENQQREAEGNSPAYTYEQFIEVMNSYG